MIFPWKNEMKDVWDFNKIQKNMIIVVDKIFNTVMRASDIYVTSFFDHG